MYRVFYVLFDYCYDNGNKKKEEAISQAFFIVLICVFCLFLAAESIIVFLQNPYSRETYISGVWTYITAGISGAAAYVTFVYKRKYYIIYDRYKDNQFLNSKPGKAIGWLTILAIFLSPLLIVALINKITIGSWL